MPDLARGLALLGIAAANSAQAWMCNSWDAEREPGWTLGGVRPDSTVDQVLAVFAAMFVHVRGLPMFSTLLGFGIGLIAASLVRKGYPRGAARRVIARRYFFLAVFGLVHMFLLFHGDIMAIYGVVGLIISLLFALSTKVLRIIAYVVMVGYAAFTTLGAVMSYAVSADFFEAPVLTPDMTSLGTYYRVNTEEALSMLGALPYAAVQLGSLALLGFIWAREGYLADVSAHRRTLITWTVIAAVVALAVGLPWGLAATGVLNPDLESPLYLLNQAFGPFTGPGILAATALATSGIQRRMYEQYAAGEDPTPPSWVYPFVALGKRSMSGYLAQSILFVALVMPFTLGIGQGASIGGKMAVAILVWAISLALATVLEARGIQGPFEWLHRHLSYGKTGQLEPFHTRTIGAMADSDPIKDRELYEKLREEGNSTSKSAAIANAAAKTSRSDVGKKGGKAGSYEDWTKEELYDRAQELDIEGRSTMSKEELIKALRHG